MDFLAETFCFCLKWAVIKSGLGENLAAALLLLLESSWRCRFSSRPITTCALITEPDHRHAVGLMTSCHFRAVMSSDEQKCDFLQSSQLFFSSDPNLRQFFFPSCCCVLISSGNELSPLRDTTWTESFPDKVGTAAFDRESENGRRALKVSLACLQRFVLTVRFNPEMKNASLLLLPLRASNNSLKPN